MFSQAEFRPAKGMYLSKAAGLSIEVKSDTHRHNEAVLQWSMSASVEVKVPSLGRRLKAGSGGRSEALIEIGYYKDRRLVLAWWGEAEVDMEWALPPARVVATGRHRVRVEGTSEVGAEVCQAASCTQGSRLFVQSVCRSSERVWAPLGSRM